jgi:hypothetical protein
MANTAVKTTCSKFTRKSCNSYYDYSENYRCKDQTEIQSSYFQKTEVSLHVTLLYRHAVLEVDGFESTIEEPRIATEQFFL